MWQPDSSGELRRTNGKGAASPLGGAAGQGDEAPERNGSWTRLRNETGPRATRPMKPSRGCDRLRTAPERGVGASLHHGSLRGHVERGPRPWQAASNRKRSDPAQVRRNSEEARAQWETEPGRFTATWGRSVSTPGDGRMETGARARLAGNPIAAKLTGTHRSVWAETS